MCHSSQKFAISRPSQSKWCRPTDCTPNERERSCETDQRRCLLIQMKITILAFHREPQFHKRENEQPKKPCSTRPQVREQHACTKKTKTSGFCRKQNTQLPKSPRQPFQRSWFGVIVIVIFVIVVVAVRVAVIELISLAFQVVIVTVAL